MLQQVMLADPRILPKVFNGLLHFGLFPRKWKMAKGISIPEPGWTDFSDPAYIRPISLLSCMGKLHEKL